jgi:hypothetical protein
LLHHREHHREQPFSPPETRGSWGWLLFIVSAALAVLWWQPWAPRSSAITPVQPVQNSPAGQSNQRTREASGNAVDLPGVGIPNRAPAAQSRGRVTRCSINGVTTFSDSACDGVAGATDIDVPPVNVVQAPRPSGMPTAHGAEQLSSNASPDSEPRCPSGLDIRNLETRLSGRIPAAANSDAVKLEIIKAKECIAIGSRYTETEWKRLRAVLRGEE